MKRGERETKRNDMCINRSLMEIGRLVGKCVVAGFRIAEIVRSNVHLPFVEFKFPGS